MRGPRGSWRGWVRLGRRAALCGYGQQANEERGVAGRGGTVRRSLCHVYPRNVLHVVLRDVQRGQEPHPS